MATYFVDFSAANNGDGSSHVQAPTPGGVGAFNSLVGLSFSIADVYWVRRQISSEPYSTINMNSTGVKLIGWPLVGDTYFHERPTDVRSAWDGDLETHAKASYRFTNLQFTEIHRLDLTTVDSFTVIAASSNITIQNCVFTITNPSSLVDIRASRVLISDTVFNRETISVTAFRWVDYNNIFLKNLTFNITNNNIASIGMMHISGNDAELVDIVFNIHSINSSAVLLAISGRFCVDGFEVNCVNYNTSDTNWCLNANGIQYARLYNLSFNNCGNRMTLNGDTFVHIKNWDQVGESPSAIMTGTSEIALVIDNFNLINNSIPPSVMSNVGFLKIGNSSLREENFQITSSTYYCMLYDCNGIVGNWKFWNGYGWYETTNTNRTGGGNYAIKVTNKLGTNTPAEMQFPHVLDDEFINLTVGDNTVTAYLALKNYGSDINANSLWMEIFYKNVVGEFVFDSTKQIGLLTPDGSTWNNERNIVPIRLQATITVAENQQAKIRIIGGPYKPGAYYYIDPNFVVT